MLLEVVLNTGEVLAAAARIGIVGEEAVIAHLGMALSPVTMHLIAAVTARLPYCADVAFSMQETSLSGSLRG